MLRQAASQAQQIAKAGRLLQGRRSTPAWITQILDSTRLQDSCSLCQSRSYASEADDAGGHSHQDKNVRVLKIADEILQLNLLELSDLTEIFQERLGIPNLGAMSYGAPPPGQGAAAPAAAAEAPVEEQTDFDVKLDSFEAAAKIKVIKEIRSLSDLGLKEAKELVEKAPVTVKTGLKKEEAEELKKKLEAVGGKVTLV